MFSQRALAIVNMLIFVIIFTILAGVLLSLVSSNTKLLEHDIRRTKALYAAQAGSVLALDALRRNATFPVNDNLDWAYYDLAGTGVIYKTVTMAGQPGVGPSNTTAVNATSDYTLNW